MSASTIANVVKMLESVPDPIQLQAEEHLKDFLADLEDEAAWDAQFAASQDWLASEAARVARESAEGRTEPMDFGRL